MCGIAGILTFGASDPAAVSAAITRMLAALEHRGPDGDGRFVSQTTTGGTIAFGHRRLAIIDLSDGGRQPMTRGDVSVTYNGEIFNYRDIRDRLADTGVRFRSTSDTEVLLAAYERWGDDCFQLFDGMFALGLWDSARGKLVLARDRLGVKPLYFHRNGSVLVFASEVRALLASGMVPRDLDPEALWHYLGYQTSPTPRTLVAGVEMLEAGHVLEIDAGGAVRTRSYWDLADACRAERPVESIAEARRRIGELLHQAVTSHLVSDVDVAVFLSGGLDSGAIVSSLATAGVRPRTFTVTLGEADYDESRLARRLATEFHTDHHEIHLRDRDLLDMLPDVLASTDHPSGDAVNSYVVSRAVGMRGLKVALSGLGGDEVFGGYPSFRRLDRLSRAAGKLGRAPGGMRRAAATFVRTAGAGTIASDKAAALLEGDGSLAAMWPITRQLFSSVARRRMLPAASVPVESAREPYAAMMAGASERWPQAGLWGAVSYAEARAYMHDVLLRDTDQMSMAHAVEVRVPLLDHRLASYVVALPDAWKRAGDYPKALLADSLVRPLPAEVLGQPKRGFTLPFDPWMRGQLRSFCERQLGERGLDGRGLLKAGEAQQLWTRFLERAPGVSWGRVWALVALNAWLERQSL